MNYDFLLSGNYLFSLYDSDEYANDICLENIVENMEESILYDGAEYTDDTPIFVFSSSLGWHDTDTDSPYYGEIPGFENELVCTIPFGKAKELVERIAN